MCVQQTFPMSKIFAVSACEREVVLSVFVGMPEFSHVGELPSSPEGDIYAQVCVCACVFVRQRDCI